MRHTVIITMLLILGTGMALAQPEPQGVMVTPEETDFIVEIAVEKPNYLAGERLELKLRLTEAAYVYVYSINVEGEVTLLFPNAYSPDNRLNAGEHDMPSSRFSLMIDGNPGTEVIQAIATQTPLNLLSLIQTALTNENPFAYIEIQPEQLVAKFQTLIAETNAPDQWAAAWTKFQIVKTKPHRWLIKSSPDELEVFLDGESIGLTPEEINLQVPSRAGETSQYELALMNGDTVVWVGTLKLSTNANGKVKIQTQPQGDYPSIDIDTNDSLTELTLDTRIPVSSFGNGLDVEPVIDADDEIEGITSVNYRRLGSLGGSLSANLGGHPLGISTFGFEFGVGFLRVGMGLADTQDNNVPEFFDIGRPEDLGPVEVFNADPEVEFYGKLSLSTGIEGIFIEFGGGIVMQERAHVAAPLGSVSAAPLDVGILPNGYISEEFDTAGIVGLAYRVGGLLLQIGYDTHRGVVGGLGVVF